VGQGLSQSSSSSPGLVFSSLKDRSSPRDPLVSHGEEPPERSSLIHDAGRRVYIFIDFDYGPIPRLEREPHVSEGPFRSALLSDYQSASLAQFASHYM